MKKLKELIKEKISQIARHEIEKWIILVEGFALNVIVPVVEDWISKNYVKNKKVKNPVSLSEYLKKELFEKEVND